MNQNEVKRSELTFQLECLTAVFFLIVHEKKPYELTFTIFNKISVKVGLSPPPKNGIFASVKDL